VLSLDLFVRDMMRDEYTYVYIYIYIWMCVGAGSRDLGAEGVCG